MRFSSPADACLFAAIAETGVDAAVGRGLWCVICRHQAKEAAGQNWDKAKHALRAKNHKLTASVIGALQSVRLNELSSVMSGNWFIQPSITAHIIWMRMAGRMVAGWGTGGKKRMLRLSKFKKARRCIGVQAQHSRGCPSINDFMCGCNGMRLQNCIPGCCVGKRPNLFFSVMRCCAKVNKHIRTLTIFMKETARG